MRTVFFLVAAGVVAAVIGGCSAIPATQPSVTLPITLPAIALRALDSHSPAFVSTAVDVTGEEEWVEYSGFIVEYEGIGLSMQATNETGSASSPDAARLRFYVSDVNGLTPSSLEYAELLIDAELPAGQSSVGYDSGVTTLSSAAERIIEDGQFYLYVLGDPRHIDVRATDVQFDLRVRVSVI